MPVLLIFLTPRINCIMCEHKAVIQKLLTSVTDTSYIKLLKSLEFLNLSDLKSVTGKSVFFALSTFIKSELINSN